LLEFLGLSPEYLFHNGNINFIKCSPYVHEVGERMTATFFILSPSPVAS
jgi:hypothetical protein